MLKIERKRLRASESLFLLDRESPELLKAKMIFRNDKKRQ